MPDRSQPGRSQPGVTAAEPAKVRNVVGGEISDYTKLMGESREQAIDRMVAEAAELGANAIIGIRFSTSEVMVSWPPGWFPARTTGSRSARAA